MKNKDASEHQIHEAKGHGHHEHANPAKSPPQMKAEEAEIAVPAEPAVATAVPRPPAEETVPVTPDPVLELQKQVEEFKEKFLRARADLENYRKRTQREYQDIRFNEKSAVLQAFLNVFDHFQMAQEHFLKNPDLQTMKMGLDMTLNEFKKAFSDLGVEQLQAAGKTFNPEFHQAVSQEASAEVPAGQVLRQWKCGYRLGEVLLRPAVVVVSSGAPAPADTAATDTQEPQI